MKLFDKILDVYYDVTWRVTDLVDKIKGHKADIEDIIEEEIVIKPKKTTKKKSAKKKKK